MADISLALSPGEIFKKERPKDIPSLKRAPKDMFIVIPARDYVASVKKSLMNSATNTNTKAYLSVVVDFLAGKKSEKDVEQAFAARKGDIDTNAVKKYFGEVLGPIYLIKKNPKIKDIIFPVRSNYELFDFFTGDGKVYTGYSSKIEGGSSNTLAPKLISERIAKLKPKTPQEKLGINVMKVMSDSPIYQGIVEAVGELVKNNIYPSYFDSNMKKAFSKINFTKDAKTIELGKNSDIYKLSLSNRQAYKTFIDKYVLPASKTISQADSKKYVSGTKKYTTTNIVYSLGKYIVETNTKGAFNLSPLVKLVFQDLNVAKMDLKSSGTVTFKISNVSKAEGNFKLRSKHRWDVVKDKLGLQL